MIDRLLSIVAPHHCFGCGNTGSILCSSCKYDIVSEPFLACVACGKLTRVGIGLCSDCRVPYEWAWCVAERRGKLQQLINSFKFENVKDAYRPLAGLLHACLPDLPDNITVVPVPTVSSHIRQRGYDHMLLVAREFARLRYLPIDTSLTRVTNSTQRGAGARERVSQAKTAFECRKKLDKNRVYLLLDDVVTSGATVKYATKTLRDAGASKVWVASISRQPLD